MLAGFLTIALVVVLILDICGAVVYFIITGFSQRKKDRSKAAAPTLRTAISSRLRPVSAQATAAVSLPSPSGTSALDVYGCTAPSTEQNAREPAGIVTGLKDRFASFRGRRLRRRPSGGDDAEKPLQIKESRNLSRILDSFREEL